MARVRHTIRNDGPTSLEIIVEMVPSRYVLQPNDEMLIEADAPAANEGFTVCVFEGGLQVYAPSDINPAVSINGNPAAPDWSTAGPNVRIAQP